MHKSLLTILLLLTLFPYYNFTASAKSSTQTTLESDAGSVVCPPGVYTAAPGDCVPFGPSEYLAKVTVAGIPYPVLPLPAYTPDSSLNDLPYHYYKVNKNGTLLYASLEDAIANNSSQSLAPGFLYISYQDAVSTDQGLFFLTRSGDWISADGARAGVSTTFQGKLFSSQPQYPFGWVLSEVKSRTAPGVNSPEAEDTWYRYNIVQIYDTQTVDNTTWNLVAPDEWLDARYVARVDPHTDPPEGVTTSRWIEINLDKQTLSVYQNDRLVFATLVSSGAGGWATHPGLFQIYEKQVADTMSGVTAADLSDYYYLEDVPWTMYFDERRALHGEYWHNRLGSPQSHGCVNLSVGDAHWLFDWASMGDYVYVYDPS